MSPSFSLKNARSFSEHVIFASIREFSVISSTFAFVFFVPFTAVRMSPFLRNKAILSVSSILPPAAGSPFSLQKQQAL